MGTCEICCIDRPAKTENEKKPQWVPYKPTMKLRISRSASKMNKNQPVKYVPILEMLMDTGGIRDKSVSSEATSSSHAMKTIKLDSPEKLR